MYVTYTRHTVADYQRWKDAFDVNARLFPECGAFGTLVIQANDKPTDIVIINTWPSKKEWDDFCAAHKDPKNAKTLKTKEDGGVLGEPEWYGGMAVVAENYPPKPSEHDHGHDECGCCC